MTWPLQPDGKKWCWVEGDMPSDWRSRLQRAAIAKGQWEDREWLGIDYEDRCLDGRRYQLGRGEMANQVLVNANLESPYSEREAGEVVIAHGWERWYNPLKVRPEWKEETRGIGEGRVHQGDSAQKQFTRFKVMDAGIWQRVNAAIDQWYKFSAWLYMWSSQKDDPNKSIEPGKMHSMVGINPWGHWPEHTATIWGKELGQDQYNQWIRAEVIAQAWHDEISVMVRTWNEWGASHVDLYIDEAVLEPIEVTIGEPGQPPPVTPPQEPIDVEELAELLAPAVSGLVVPKVETAIQTESNVWLQRIMRVGEE